MDNDAKTALWTIAIALIAVTMLLFVMNITLWEMDTGLARLSGQLDRFVKLYETPFRQAPKEPK